MKRCLTVVLFSLCLVFSLFSATVFAETKGGSVVASGECGANAVWSLDSEGVLTISGSGEMASYVHKYKEDGDT